MEYCTETLMRLYGKVKIIVLNLYRRILYVNKLKRIIDSNTTVISNNCFAGRIYNDLGLPYNSPTVGLYFFYPDYIVFLQYLEHYISCELKFRKESKYDLGRERHIKAGKSYPIGYLEYNGIDVEIEFLHYKSEQEALEKWNRRCRRINLDKLVVIGCDRDCCTKNDIDAFDVLPYKHKYFLSSRRPDSQYQYRSVLFVKEMEKKWEIEDYANAHIAYKYILRHEARVI